MEQTQVSVEIDRKAKIVEDECPSIEIVPPAYSTTEKNLFESPLAVSFHCGHWTLKTAVGTKRGTRLTDIKTVLYWLEIIIEQPSDEGFLRQGTWETVLKRRDWSVSLIDLKDDVLSSHNSCWRRKIIDGKVLGSDELCHEPVSANTRNRWYPQIEAGLRLTAACLWSLFDNALQRVLGCSCTFISEGGDYLQCKYKRGRWLIWHIPEFTNDLCNGYEC